MEIRGKSLEYWKQNAEDNYLTTPISVLKYISVLEEAILQLKGKPVTELNERNSVDEGEKSCEHDWVYKILFDHTACDVCTKCKEVRKQTG